MTGKDKTDKREEEGDSCASAGVTQPGREQRGTQNFTKAIHFT